MCSFLMSFRHSKDLRICVHVCTSGRKNFPKRICPTQNRRENCPESDCPGVNCPRDELSGGSVVQGDEIAGGEMFVPQYTAFCIYFIHNRTTHPRTTHPRQLNPRH